MKDLLNLSVPLWYVAGTLGILFVAVALFTWVKYVAPYRVKVVKPSRKYSDTWNTIMELVMMPYCMIVGDRS